MYTRQELEAIDRSYLEVIIADEYDVTIMSRNTRHIWHLRNVELVYNIGKKKLISFCVDTGFTCFGLVEQNYELPEEVLREMGVETIPVPRTQVERIDVPRTQIMGSGVETSEYETIDITVLRRGVIGVNKIGYVPR